jgi:hypothetical protein
VSIYISDEKLWLIFCDKYISQRQKNKYPNNKQLNYVEIPDPFVINLVGSHLSVGDLSKIESKEFVNLDAKDIEDIDDMEPEAYGGFRAEQIDMMPREVAQTLMGSDRWMRYGSREEQAKLLQRFAFYRTVYSNAGQQESLLSLFYAILSSISQTSENREWLSGLKTKCEEKLSKTNPQWKSSYNIGILEEKKAWDLFQSSYYDQRGKDYPNYSGFKEI